MRQTLLILASLCCASAFAQSPIIDNATIDSSGANYQGNVGVNQAAGDLQQQSNARALATGRDANAITEIRQRMGGQVDGARDTRASIQGDAFSNGNGALGVNQTAGAANQQANALRISISAQPQSLDDSVLMQQNVALVNTSDATGSDTGYRQVNTSDQAFTGSRGVIQLNQSAGVGNRMANTFSVHVAQ
ncbi:adhesin [Pseudomonas sp. NPDC089401]|uniref:adhesin n=1 Tax=Pseudomonas sp. NPDC089401 TaxID=3364462 RepID=UPI00380C83C8